MQAKGFGQQLSLRNYGITSERCRSTVLNTGKEPEKIWTGKHGEVPTRGGSKEVTGSWDFLGAGWGEKGQQQSAGGFCL